MIIAVSLLNLNFSKAVMFDFYCHQRRHCRHHRDWLTQECSSRRCVLLVRELRLQSGSFPFFPFRRDRRIACRLVIHSSPLAPFSLSTHTIPLGDMSIQTQKRLEFQLNIRDTSSIYFYLFLSSPSSSSRTFLTE